MYSDVQQYMFCKHLHINCLSWFYTNCTFHTKSSGNASSVTKPMIIHLNAANKLHQIFLSCMSRQPRRIPALCMAGLLVMSQNKNRTQRQGSRILSILFHPFKIALAHPYHHSSLSVSCILIVVASSIPFHCNALEALWSNIFWLEIKSSCLKCHLWKQRSFFVKNRRGLSRSGLHFVGFFVGMFTLHLKSFIKSTQLTIYQNRSISLASPFVTHSVQGASFI